MIHAPMACGGEANGVRLLSPTGSDPVFDEQTYAQDLVLPLKLRHGIGYGLPSPDMPISPNPRVLLGRMGRSLAVIDLDARMSFAYVMNKMGDSTSGDLRARRRSSPPSTPGCPDLPHRSVLSADGVFRVAQVCTWHSDVLEHSDVPKHSGGRTSSVGFGPADEVVGAKGV